MTEAEKDLYRYDSIPELEESASDQEVRVLAKDCGQNKKYLRVDLQTDSYGFENKWKLKEKQGNKWVEIESGPPGQHKYGRNKRYTGGYCLAAGDYRFFISDLFKDGMCCNFGNGKYSISIDGTEFSSPKDDRDWETRMHEFSVSTSNGIPGGMPFESKGMTGRDTEWLVAHNQRRRSWHQRYGKSYVPLKWSNALKDESKDFAEKLLRDSCGDLYHDSNNIHGENLASNSGSGGEWANVRTADSIVTRWVEDEVDDIWPKNGHLTQVLWRSTEYVGCAEASKPRGDGGMCHAQVCRYARPGNCNMNKYKNGKKDWWIEPVMMDESPCGSRCPPDGCR